MANIKAGIRLPTRPTLANFSQCLRVILFRRRAIKGASTIPAELILSAPTSIGPKAINPFLINKKELPQINASNPNNNQALSGGVLFVVILFAIPLVEFFFDLLDAEAF